MNYACLVYQNEALARARPEHDFDGIVEECIEWLGELEKDSRHVFSSGLQSSRSAVTLRGHNGKVSVTDGPFAETKEIFGGFTIFSARDLNEAIQIASRSPMARFGTVEVRPVFNPEADLPDPLDKNIAGSIRRASKLATVSP